MMGQFGHDGPVPMVLPLLVATHGVIVVSR